MVAILKILSFDSKFAFFGALEGDFFGTLRINVHWGVNQFYFDATKLTFKRLHFTYLQMFIHILSRKRSTAELTYFWVHLAVIPTMLPNIFSGENFFTKFASLRGIRACFIYMLSYFSPLYIFFAMNA